jgi:hypothetical protein
MEKVTPLSKIFSPAFSVFFGAAWTKDHAKKTECITCNAFTMKLVVSQVFMENKTEKC